MSKSPQISLTTFLAVWGALLSSITFGWNLFRDLRDRAKVRLRASLFVLLDEANGKVMAIHPGLLKPEERIKIHLVVTVTNVGRRPLRWAGLGGNYRKPINNRERFVITTRDLPKTLAEADTHDEYLELDQAFTTDNVKRLFIWDSSGRNWRLPRQQLRKVIRDVKKYVAHSHS